MRMKTALVAVFALAFQAQGTPVSPSEAASAVRGWAVSGERLGVNFRDRLDLSSGAVETTAVHTASSGATFYAVRLRGCGTVFMSGDTEVEPVIAFTESAADYSTRNGSPFWILLDGDISTRRPADGASEKWSRYWAADPERPRRLKAAGPRTDEPSDLRVAPLVKSKWDQGGGIYNYYTPPGEPGDPGNYPCGCVATMTAQIMRYLHGPVGDDALGGGLGIPFPLEHVEAKTVKCQVDGKDKNLKMQGGMYAWDNMPLTADGIDDEQKQNIGKLTSDVGIASEMSYSNGVSGTSVFQAMDALTKTFGYKQAFGMFVKNEHGYGPIASLSYAVTWSDDVLPGSIFANLDARRPCMLSISNTTQEEGRKNGHAIIADGYGFEGEDRVPYVHLNMGWSGAEDMWYNLPAMGTYYDFNDIDTIGYNIFPDIGGDPDVGGGASVTHAIMSGRVLAWESGSGYPVSVEGATVKVFRAGESEVVTNVTTDAKGVWAAIIPAGTYDVEAQSAGSLGVTNGVEVSAPMYNIFSGTAEVGNSWGNDIVLGDPMVLAGNDTVGYEPFGTINRAVNGARERYDDTTGEAMCVKVVAPDASFTDDAVIDFNCVMFVTNDSPSAWAVWRKDGATLSVADGMTLVMSNIVFASGSGTVVNVASNGCLGISGLVDFGVDYKTAAVKTADTNGFWLVGAIEKGFTLDCLAATNKEYDVVGHCSPESYAEFLEMVECAPLIANYRDDSREVRAMVFGASSPYDLIWKKQEVPLSESVAYFVETNGYINAAGRLDVALERYEEALAYGSIDDNGNIYVLRNDSLSHPLVVGTNTLSIVGKGVEISVEPSAGFTVTGGVLSVSGISFRDYMGSALFLVNGEEAKLSVSNVAFTAIEGTNKWSGAIAILKGSASVDDSEFCDCNATGLYNRNLKKSVKTKGGAIYVAEGCSLFIKDSTITNCYSRTSNSGGGIYAAKNAKIKLSGNVVVLGNVSGSDNDQKEDDIRLANTLGANAHLVLDDIVTGEVGLFWENSGKNGFGNTNGMFFAEAQSEDVATNSVKAFFCTAVGSDVVADAVQDGSDWKLQWVDAPVGPQPLPYDPSTGTVPEGAFAGVVGADGSETNYYDSVADAITVAKDGETVALLSDTNVFSDIVVSSTNVSLVSFGDEACTIWRATDCSIIVEPGASLMVSNVWLMQTNPTEDFRSAKNPLFDVRGGMLTLAAGAKILSLTGAGTRNASAVSVWKGGTFEMESGADIGWCVNRYESQSDGCGRGAGVLVDDGKAVFRGGSIFGCQANTGGGVFVGNKGAIEVSGDINISGNWSLDYSDSNLVVCDNCRLVLSGPLTGGAKIGYTEGSSGDANVFGTVAESVSDEDAAASATNFTHDVNGDFGVAVKNGESRLLVWSAALDDNGKYVDGDGNEYELIAGSSVEIPVPPAAIGLVYANDAGIARAQTGVVESVGFTVVGNVASNAGSYTATASLRHGYVWVGGSSDPTNISWSIAKAIKDMSEVAFNDKTITYDGNWHYITIEGVLPTGVSVAYDNNRRREVGSQEATVYFTVDDPLNYAASVASKTAMLNIEAAPVPTWPATLSFGARGLGGSSGLIGQSAAQSLPQSDPAAASSDDWVISAVAEREGQWFSLYETNSLSGGFNIEGMEPVERKQAVMEDGVPVIRFTRQQTSNESRYWRIVAEP